MEYGLCKSDLRLQNLTKFFLKLFVPYVISSYQKEFRYNMPSISEYSSLLIYLSYANKEVASIKVFERDFKIDFFFL